MAAHLFDVRPFLCLNTSGYAKFAQPDNFPQKPDTASHIAMTLDSAKADRWTSIVLFVLGLAMLVGGLTMDRLEIRRIHPASIPGLVPIMLGFAMMLCSVFLFVSARTTHALANAPQRQASEQADDADDTSSDSSPPSLHHLFFAAAYSTFYALVLVGPLPFALASAIYIAVFYIHFTWTNAAPLRVRTRLIIYGIGFGLTGGYAIASLFEHGFLVRLP